MTRFQIGATLAAWFAIGAVICIALAGCTSPQARYTPFIAPACVALCFTEVKQVYQAVTPEEYP